MISPAPRLADAWDRADGHFAWFKLHGASIPKDEKTYLAEEQKDRASPPTKPADCSGSTARENGRIYLCRRHILLNH